VGLRETLARTLGSELPVASCALHALGDATRNFCPNRATAHATSAQLEGHSPSVRRATAHATAAQLPSCTQVALQGGCATAVAPLARPYRLTPAGADRCHAGGWDDAEIETFTTRVMLLMRRGVPSTDADDLAERLVKRDRDGDDRRMCHECAAYRPGRCGNHQSAGLHKAELGRDLATTLQRCPGFTPAPIRATPTGRQGPALRDLAHSLPPAPVGGSTDVMAS
jgi:hypothetical protein